MNEIITWRNKVCAECGGKVYLSEHVDGLCLFYKSMTCV